MADKPRVKAPKPRVKAPQQRAAPGAQGGGRRTLVLGIAGGVGVVALIAIGLFFVLGSGGGSADAVAALKNAGCTLTIKPGGKPLHSVLNPNGTSKQWNTFPPTSGPHYAEPAIWGAYDQPLQQARVVHNLEHGGIFIQYGSKVPASTVARLRTFYGKHLAGTLLSPLPALGNEIALGAWVHTQQDLQNGTNGHGYLAKCTNFDGKAFSAFFSSYQFHGSHVNSPALEMPGM